MNLPSKSLVTSCAIGLLVPLLVGISCGFLFDVPVKIPLIVAFITGILLLGGVLICLQSQLMPTLERIKVFFDTLAANQIPQSLDASDMPEFQQTAWDVEKTLRRYRGMAYGIVHGMPMPYLLVDTEERALFTNNLCLKMLEIDDSVENCRGKTLATLFYNDPTKETAVGKSIRNGDVFHNLQVTISGHKGTKTDVLANVYPLYDIDKTCVGGLCLYVDMTRIKSAEQAIKDKNAKMAQIALKLEDAAATITSYSATLANAIAESDRSAVEASQRLSGTVQSMNQMNESAHEVAQSASKASDESRITKEKAESGASIVKQSLKSIEDVYTFTKRLTEDMGELKLHANNITQIMSVISDIADQTNLLALNAAIEAARAGDAGRGFAVVADEVRKLAEKTMSSASDVSRAIESIQKSTEKSVTSMASAVEQVNKANELANESGQALQEIVTTVESTADQVNAIANTSVAQTSVSKDITDSLLEVDSSVRLYAKSLTDATKTVSDLNEQAKGLVMLVNQLEEA